MPVARVVRAPAPAVVTSSSPRGRIRETVGSRSDDLLEATLVSDAVDTSGSLDAAASGAMGVELPCRNAGPPAAPEEDGLVSTV